MTTFLNILLFVAQLIVKLITAGTLSLGRTSDSNSSREV